MIIQPTIIPWTIRVATLSRLDDSIVHSVIATELSSRLKEVGQDFKLHTKGYNYSDDGHLFKVYGIITIIGEPPMRNIYDIYILNNHLRANANSIDMLDIPFSDPYLFDKVIDYVKKHQ